MPDSRENHTFFADTNDPVPSGKAGGGDIVARLYGESVTEIPGDLYIPPEALEVFLEAFEGPLDLLLYLIRRQNFNILDIPMAQLTLQYLHYVDRIRVQKLELAAEYLLMAAMLVEIKSRLLLPKVKTETNEEPEDPRAELVRRLLEYERMKMAAKSLDELPKLGNDFFLPQAVIAKSTEKVWPGISADELLPEFLLLGTPPALQETSIRCLSSPLKSFAHFRDIAEQNNHPAMNASGRRTARHIA